MSLLGGEGTEKDSTFSLREIRLSLYHQSENIQTCRERLEEFIWADLMMCAGEQDPKRSRE